MGGFLSVVLLFSIFGNVLDLFFECLLYVGYYYVFMIFILFLMMGLLGVLLIKEKEKKE